MRNITLPDGWIYGKLGEFISEVRLRNKNNEISRVLSVTNNKGFLESKEYFNKQVYSKDLINYKIVKRNQIAYNPSRINVGSIDVLENFDEGIISPLYVIFSCNKRLLPRYLVYYLKSDRGNAYIRGNTSGSVRDTLKFSDLCNIDIIVPPLQKQKKIVELLEKVEDTIEKRKESIKLLDELVKSQFIEMFGDPVQNPFGWKLKPFLESGSCKNGMNFSATETGIELQYLGVGDFKDLSKIEDVTNLGKVNLNKMPSKEYLLQNGDIVFVRSNGNKTLVGRCLAVYPNDVATTYSGFCIRYRKTDENIEIPYLLQVLKTNSMRKNMAGRGANIQNLNQQILGELMIPIPPLELQKQYSEFVKEVDKLKFEMEESLKELENNFNSLMQKAFNGELF